jgi:hypothetical protein
MMQQSRKWKIRQHIIIDNDGDHGTKPDPRINSTVSTVVGDVVVAVADDQYSESLARAASAH